MEHDRLAELLRSTPLVVAEPQPRPELLLRAYRRRRARRVAATAIATSFAVAGVVTPLALLGGIGGHDRSPAPLASGSSVASTTAPRGNGPFPDVGLISCTLDGAVVDTPVFRVQADGPHLRVADTVGAGGIVLRGGESGRGAMTLPADTAEPDLVAPWLAPGSYSVACGVGDGASDAPTIRLADPERIWTDPRLDCSSTTAMVLSDDVASRSDLPAVIRAAVHGIAETDDLSPAGYPGSDEGITYLVQRDGDAVASVKLLARSLPAERPVLQVASCDGSGIADGQGPR